MYNGDGSLIQHMILYSFGPCFFTALLESRQKRDERQREGKWYVSEIHIMVVPEVKGLLSAATKKKISLGLQCCVMLNSKGDWGRNYIMRVCGKSKFVVNTYIYCIVTQSSCFHVGGWECWSFVAHRCRCDKPNEWERPPTTRRQAFLCKNI